MNHITIPNYYVTRYRIKETTFVNESIPRQFGIDSLTKELNQKFITYES